jgi:hypothetical protein
MVRQMMLSHYITLGNYELLVGVRDGGNQEVIQNFRTNSNIK